MSEPISKKGPSFLKNKEFLNIENVITDTILSSKSRNIPEIDKLFIKIKFFDYIKKNGYPPYHILLKWYMAGWYLTILPIKIKLESKGYSLEKQNYIIEKMIEEYSTLIECLSIGYCIYFSS